nr:protein FREE1 [Tanacetum cinerariifolium]
MQQPGDYTTPSYYPTANYPPQNPNPNPNPNPPQPPLTYASAPPTYQPPDYYQSYHSHHQQPQQPDPNTPYFPPPPNPNPISQTPPLFPQFDSPNAPYPSNPNPNPNPSYDHHQPLINHTSSFQYPSVPNPVSLMLWPMRPLILSSHRLHPRPPPPKLIYGKRTEPSGGGVGYGDGVYAYQGGKSEPYGARGTGAKSSTWKEKVVFDDFGRPIGGVGGGGGGLGGKDSFSSVSSPKIVKAVPKVETREDVKGGVQKFRVKLLAESGGQSTMDVLCQIGLDGIRMLDPSTSRTLRIYPLDTVTRCEVYDSSTLAFWSKSSVDIEPRRIRLQSSSYTTNTLLDTITAATFQVKEMGGRSRPVDAVKVTEQSTEKKKGLGDWMNIIKPPNEEKDHWVPDEAVTKCTGCGSDFSAFNRKHHCRNCGDIFCDKCTHGRIALTSEDNAPQVRVCDRCMLEVTHRLSSAKEAAASRSSGLQSHEDLAKKLQEELERNHKPSSGFKSEGSSRRMKEVACPTCTVHLQVQVPSSGSETIECGVCQHPFLVSAR